MKKITVLAIMALSISFGSCRKERVCECKTTSTEVRTGFGEKTTVSNSSTKATKEKQMKTPFKYSSDCFSDSHTEFNSGGNGATAWSSQTQVEKTCELK